jgi:hypothetical protein
MFVLVIYVVVSPSIHGHQLDDPSFTATTFFNVRPFSNMFEVLWKLLIEAWFIKPYKYAGVVLSV